jgi:hypothetical protein
MKMSDKASLALKRLALILFAQGKETRPAAWGAHTRHGGRLWKLPLSYIRARVLYCTMAYSNNHPSGSFAASQSTDY